MKVCIYGFSTMDYKGEETNELYFIAKVIEELTKSGADVFYLFHQSSQIGLNNKEVFKLFNIPAKRLAVDKYNNFAIGEFENYKIEEIEEAVQFNYELDKILTQQDRKEHFMHNCVAMLENIKEYDSTFNFDRFIFWGNSLVASTLRMYCKKNKKKYFNLENGYFRPFTLMVDPKGVNFESSIPRDKEFYKSIIVDEAKMHSYLNTPIFAVENKEEVNWYREKYYEFYGFSIREQSTEINEVLNKEIYDEEYVYVPFQLETDSQILKHSKYIKSMEELVKYTLEGVKAYNSKYEKNLKVIYKEHPLYATETSSKGRSTIEKLIAESNEAIYLTKGDNKQLLKNAVAVITINSTVGIEALSLLKPVITLGDAYYNIESIVFEHNFSDDLSKTLYKSISTPLDKSLISKFLYYLRFGYHFEIYKKYPDFKSVKLLSDNIFNL